MSLLSYSFFLCYAHGTPQIQNEVGNEFRLPATSCGAQKNAAKPKLRDVLFSFDIVSRRTRDQISRTFSARGPFGPSPTLKETC